MLERLTGTFQTSSIICHCAMQYVTVRLRNNITHKPPGAFMLGSWADFRWDQLLVVGEPYLKSDVCLRPDLGGRDLKIRLFVYKIHTDQFFTLFSLVARQTLAYWLIDPDDALSSILTVKIITGAGTRENHGWRKLTKQATEEWTGKKKYID